MHLTTPRLVLREFVEEDWRPVLAYQSEPLYLRYNPWTHRTEQDVRAFLRMFISWQIAKPRTKFQLAITLASNGQFIGNCGIRMPTPHAKEADLGYELAPQYWEQGYATEAARAMLAFGFQELGLHRIHANCVLENTASAHVLKKIGMRQEGHLHKKEWMKDRWWDTLLFAILNEEWQAQT